MAIQKYSAAWYRARERRRVASMLRRFGWAMSSVEQREAAAKIAALNVIVRPCRNSKGHRAIAWKRRPAAMVYGDGLPFMACIPVDKGVVSVEIVGAL